MRLAVEHIHSGPSLAAAWAWSDSATPGRTDHACSAALRSLDVALQTGSGVGVADVRKLRADSQPYASTDVVRELEEALAVQR